jgi:hypothetical protein
LLLQSATARFHISLQTKYFAAMLETVKVTALPLPLARYPFYFTRFSLIFQGFLQKIKVLFTDA